MVNVDIGPYEPTETPELARLIVGLPSVPFALVTLSGLPTAIDRPYTAPPLTATSPVAPVRSAMLLRADTVAVRVSPPI